MSRFHLPLQEGDSLTITVGCRSSRPNGCSKNNMAGICAFVGEDGICLIPPKSWKRQYSKLKLELKTAREFFVIKTEVAGKSEEESVIDTRVHPQKVAKLKYQLAGWLGDVSFRCLAG